MDTYSTTMDKLALAVSSAKLAKETIIESEGIGEDLNFVLMGWREGELVAVAQLGQIFMRDKPDRFGRLLKCAYVIRKGWGVDAFTFVAEAFCSNTHSTREHNLTELFVNSEVKVTECLSFIHIDKTVIEFVAVPYTTTHPRLVVFSDAIQYEGIQSMRDSEYPAALYRALNEDTEGNPIYDDDFHSELVKGLIAVGFEVNYK